MGPVLRDCVPGRAGCVVLDPGEVATPNECERSDADSSGL
jgi:hypothetical protein